MNKYLSELLDYAVEKNLIEKDDVIYCANRVMYLIGGDMFEKCEYTPHENLEQILEGLLDFAAQSGKLEADTLTYRDLLSAEIMDVFTPRPSYVRAKFNELYAESPKKATDYFYEMSKNNNYIMTNRVKKNIIWKKPTENYDDIDITINLSKPEKDPKDIELAKLAKATAEYPKCLLCKENEGFAGHMNHPGRANHRIMPITLAGEKWNWQYSPYVYYNEHCIVFKDEHEPMLISQKTFDRLLDFVDIFPHYFLGSNAGLPIVGGSILTHDHYQGGNYEFPMAKCPITVPVTFKGYEDISAGIVSWPLSTIRIAGDSKQRVSDLATKILECWREHTDEENEILAYTDQPHNAITPIARRKGEKFEMDLILRNNRTSEEHPLGIFHAHSEYHHIKKENIGLIEAMGLAVLPARLATELGELTDEVKSEIGEVFTKILENCGVYKNTEIGKKGFIKFIEAVNNK
jgi:UDPglucose--hexose-1-phosphate uridylyltransferase